jgi:3'(2'), 5'-bisphosphate nucleotidase
MNDHLVLAIDAALQAGKSIIQVYATDFTVDLKPDNSPLTLADMRSHEIILRNMNKTGLPVVSEEGSIIPYYKRESWQKFWLIDPLDGTKEFVSRNGEFSVNIALIDKRKAVMGIIYAPVTDTLYFSDDTGAWKVDKAAKKFDNQIGIAKFKLLSDKLPLKRTDSSFAIVASRSHLNTQTTEFINKVKQKHDEIRILSRGSSLKFCMIAEGAADVYPRFGVTSEWDTAAGHAIVSAAGGKVVRIDDESTELIYNNHTMENPPFIAYPPKLLSLLLKKK